MDLRNSPYAEGFDLPDVVRVADATAEQLPRSSQASDFLSFIERVARLDD